MNENPGGTPNPLRPAPEGSAPAPVRPVTQNIPVRPTVSNPLANQPASPAAPSVPVSPTAPINTAMPANRPIEQAAPTEVPKKKKKTGLIAGIIAAVTVLLIGGIVAAVVLINMNKMDPVTAAMKKIMDGEAPTNVAIGGDIDVAINDEYSPISNLKINLNSSLITNSMVNDSVAKATITIRNVGDLEVEFDEVYAGDGDLYFKIDGATTALENSGLLYLLNLSGQLPEVVDCGEDDYCQTNELEEITCTEGENCEDVTIDDTELNIVGNGVQNILDADTLEYFASLIDIVEVIDGDWLRVSVNDLNMLSSGITTSSDISCVTGLVSSINTNSNSAAELYSKYPFIASTNKNVNIESKNYPVYKVSIDSENFANYVNSIQNSDLSSNLYSCLGWNNNVKVSDADVAKIVEEMPTVYAEVDDENNFSRIYLNSDLNDGEATITIDLNFSYPSSVNVSSIEEYQDFSTLLEEIFSSMYTLPDNTDGTVYDYEINYETTIDN